MTVKSGDVVEFLAISWDESQWEFDYPTVILKPAIRYSPNGEHPERMIEDMAIDLSCGDDVEDEDVSDEFEWRGWKVSVLRKAAKERLEGKCLTWKTKVRCVLRQKVKFIEENGDLSFKVIETIQI